MPVVDIYAKQTQDPTYNSSTLEIRDQYEMLLQHIKMILFGRKGEVLGDPDFGVNLDDYVFEIGLSNDSIKEKIVEQFQKYIPGYDTFNIDIDVKFYKGTIDDICTIDILIDGKRSFTLYVD